jgi:hypothetical protein
MATPSAECALPVQEALSGKADFVEFASFADSASLSVQKKV